MIISESKKPSDYLRNLDWLMLAVVVALHVIGAAVLRSVAIQQGNYGIFTRQLLAMVIGWVGLIILLFFDYKDFRVIGVVLWILTTVMLGLVLVIGFGREEVGMSGWLMIGPASFQPSEFAKITMVLGSALFFERLRDKPSILNFLILLISFVLPIGLVLMQPDFGTAMVLVFTMLCMFFAWGLKYRWILLGLAVTVASAIPVWVYVLPEVLDTYQMNRLLSFINPAAFSKDAAYQVRMAIRAIGSGQTEVDFSRDFASNWVPAVHTDMIFSALGEKLGFYGTALTVVLFAIFLLRGIAIAVKARDKFGAYIAIGLVSIFLAHYLENVGMNLGLMPVTGIPLPFISAGGSSLIANNIAVGILLGISMRKRTLPQIE